MKEDLVLATDAAREAGRAVLTYFQKKLSVRDKGNDNPVTQADLESDRILRSRLMESRPDYGWLSEETVDSPERLSRRFVWIVDPIDGTKEFIKGVPEFAISIGLVEDGRPIVGVVYNPATGELFSASRGGGAYLDGAPIRVSATRFLKDGRLEASRTEFAGGRFAEILTSVSRIEPIGSIAYKLARVAAGRSDMVFSFTPKSEWDICGATAIIEEAGGVVTLSDGGPIRFNRENPQIPGIAASNGHLHNELLSRISRG